MERKLVPQKPFLEVLCAIQGALGEENQKVFARASVNLGRKWATTITRANNADDLMEKIAAYLRDDLQLAKTVKLEKEGQDYILKVRECYVCHGKLVKERHGITPVCAMSMFPVGALTENLKIRSALSNKQRFLMDFCNKIA